MKGDDGNFSDLEAAVIVLVGFILIREIPKGQCIEFFKGLTDGGKLEKTSSGTSSEGKRAGR